MWARYDEISPLRLRKKSRGRVTYSLVAFGELCERQLFRSGLEATSGLHLNVSPYTLQGGFEVGGLPGCSHCEVLLEMRVSRR